jgi:hypothetical protein
LKEQNEGAKAEPLQLLPVEPPVATPEAEVWTHYQAVRKRWRKHSRSTALGDKDRREIKARLKGGYTVADLAFAVDGLFASVWHRENERLALTYALRETNIAGFIDAAERERRRLAPRVAPVDASPSNDVDRGQAFDVSPSPRSLDTANAILVEPGEEPRPCPILDFSPFSRGM